MDVGVQTSGLHPTPLIACSIVIGWTIYVLAVATYNVTLHPLAKYPGPKLWAAFWWPDSLSMFTGRQVRDHHALHQRYGRVVRVNPDGLSFTDSRVWKDVYGFRTGQRQMQKDPRVLFRAKNEKIPRNILIAHDADHARYRRLLAHAFSDQALREQEAILNIYFDLFMRKLQDHMDGPTQGKVNLVELYNYTTFDIIGDLTLADSFHTLETGEYHPWITNTFKAIKFIRWLRMGARYRLLMNIFQVIGKLAPGLEKSLATHLRYTNERVDERFGTETDRKDFMTYILRHNDEKGMTQDEIKANAAILLIAGSETTATALCGATYHLLRNPDKLQKLQREIRHAFGSADEINLISSSKLPYLQATLQEALRLYPPVPGGNWRVTPPTGAEVAGSWIPGNMSVAVHHYSAYRDPENFADPESFAPERFLREPPPKFADDDIQVFQPFSFGPRNCLGRNLAFNEMRSILARILFMYDLALCDESQNWTEQKVWALWEKGPLLVQLSKPS